MQGEPAPNPVEAGTRNRKASRMRLQARTLRSLTTLPSEPTSIRGWTESDTTADPKRGNRTAFRELKDRSLRHRGIAAQLRRGQGTLIV